MHFPDRYRYPLFFAGVLAMIVGAFAYKFGFLSLNVEEAVIVAGTVLFVFSMASSLIDYL